jgi:DNA-binding MarR family transcriptional regulator
MQREALIEAIFTNMQQMHRAGTAKFHAMIGQLDISPSQLGLLRCVKELQPVSVKDIAAYMRLTPGAVTQLMEGLVASGYLERRPDTRDRRVTHVSLAEGGSKKLKELWERRKAALRGIMQELDTEELAVMLKVQKKMLHHMEAYVETVPKTKQ